MLDKNPVTGCGDESLFDELDGYDSQTGEHISSTQGSLDHLEEYDTETGEPMDMDDYDSESGELKQPNAGHSDLANARESQERSTSTGPEMLMKIDDLEVGIFQNHGEIGLARLVNDNSLNEVDEPALLPVPTRSA